MERLLQCALFLAIVHLGGCAQNHDRRLEVTHIGNEGFMIAMGGTKVLIDALSRSEYYAGPSDSTVAKMMGDVDPFDNIDYVLVTHDHPDHFNAAMVSRYLLKHPAVQFLADPGTCRRLEGDGMGRWQHAGIDLQRGGQRAMRGEKAEIVALSLAHGGSRSIDNLAFLVRSNGYTIMHVGDAKLAFSEEILRNVDWSSHSVDLLFIQYSDRSTPTHDIIRDLIKPKYVILMHIPPGEEESVRNEPEKIHPRTVVFRRESEMKRFDELTEEGASP